MSNPLLICSRDGAPPLARVDLPGAVAGLKTTAPFDISLREYIDRAQALGYTKADNGGWYHAGLDFFVQPKTRADGSVARHYTVLALNRQAEGMRQKRQLQRWLIVSIAALAIIFTAAMLGV